MRGTCGRGERPQVRIKNEISMWLAAAPRAERRQLHALAGSHEEGRLLVALQRQSGAERHDPQAERGSNLPAGAVGELVGQSAPVGLPNPVLEDQARNVLGNKWVHVPVPFYEPFV